MDFAGRIHNKAGGREFVVDSGASLHMLSKRDLNSAEIGDHEDIEESDDGDDGQRRGANKRRGNSVCQRFGFIRDSNASRRNTGSSLSRKTLRRSRVYLPLDQWSKTTTHKQWKTHGKCNTANYVPFVVLGLTTSSSSSFHCHLRHRYHRKLYLYTASRINRK